MAKKDKNKKADADAEEIEKDNEQPEAAPEAGEGEGAPEGAVAPGKSKKKVILLGVVAILLLVGLAAGAYYDGLFLKKEDRNVVAIGPDGKPIERPVYYTLPEFLINLNTSGRQTSFLKTTVILELARQEDVPVIEADLPRLLDSINTYMRELRASDLSGSAGIQRLREELMLRCNKVLAPIKINDVLFKEIIIQ